MSGESASEGVRTEGIVRRLGLRLRAGARRPGTARPEMGDLVAGISVGVVMIPQALAYAELAGMPPYTGLFAAALPPILAAFFSSSRYLQTGPVAMTALLTYGALLPLGAEPASPQWVRWAGLLALMVGIMRLALGLVRGGVIAFLLSQPVLKGFTSAAAILIFLSQLPTALGVQKSGGGILIDAWDAVSDPAKWNPWAVALSLVVVAVVLVAPKIHPLLPGVPFMLVLGIVVGRFTGYDAALVGDVPATFPPLSFSFPWADLPQLVMPAIVVALVGFAEPASIARTFAAADRESWSADRELIAQGVANVASAVSGAFPVGGSFARTSIARLAGARTRWTGLIVGVLVLAFLPLAGWLAHLPKAVLAAIILAAVTSLMRPDQLIHIWRVTPLQGAVGMVTFVATLALSPRIDIGVTIGVGLAIVLHLWRELRVPIDFDCDGDTLTVRLTGVLFFGSAQGVDDELVGLIAEHEHVDRVVIDLEGVGRLDYSGARTLKSMSEHLASAGSQMELININPAVERIVARVWDDRDHPST